MDLQKAQHEREISPSSTPYGPSSRAWVVAHGRRQDEEFDTAGRADVAAVMQRPARFDRCVNADICKQMIARAGEQSAGMANLEFIVNGSDKLPGIAAAPA